MQYDIAMIIMKVDDNNNNDNNNSIYKSKLEMRIELVDPFCFAASCSDSASSDLRSHQHQLPRLVLLPELMGIVPVRINQHRGLQPW